MVEIFNKWKESLDKTRRSTFSRISNLFGTSEINESFWDDLESMLVQADLGIETSTSIVDSLKNRTIHEGLTRISDLQEVLYRELIKRLDVAGSLDLFTTKPTVILLVGVNGSGKTTTAAKLAKIFSEQEKKVLFGAADTYRAAAVDQLKVWAERLAVPIVYGQPEADPAAVAYDAVQAAVARKLDVAIIDTAGRLHTRYNLMEELRKVHRVVGKAVSGAPHASWLVLDASTGQNALSQAKAFREAIHINGIILTKLDTSARGGMAFSIQHNLKLPILYAGLGEQIDDLKIFNPEAFVKGIMEK